jgi:DNA-binding XRE family transcriptional regulator
MRLFLLAALALVAASAASQDAVPRDSVPQYLPCPDQPKSFQEFSKSFAAGRLPLPSDVTGSWALMGIWVHKAALDDVEDVGAGRGRKLSFRSASWLNVVLDWDWLEGKSMVICDRLRALREEKKLSQGDIEKRTGLLRCYISRVENDYTVPTVETLEKMARALEVPLFVVILRST